MKKLVLLLSFLFSFSLVSLASNTKLSKNSTKQEGQGQNDKIERSEKKNKYDFSLFKFISPAKPLESDTINPVNPDAKPKSEINGKSMIESFMKSLEIS